MSKSEWFAIRHLLQYTLPSTLLAAVEPFHIRSFVSLVYY
jgi:hypothetical protein